MNVDVPASVLIGRDDERARLGRLLDGVLAGSGGSAWIEGEPGIGKSALLATALDDAERRGCRVFRATADELGRESVLGLMLDCLNVDFRSVDPVRREIADLLFTRDGTDAFDPVAVAADRLVGLVHRTSADAPLVLAVDDLQWADEASVLVLHRLGRLVRRAPILLIGACRPVRDRSDLVTLKRGLAASGAETMTLAPLPSGAVAALVGALTGAAVVGPRLGRAAEQAGGNPFYLREMVTALTGDDRLRLDHGTAELAEDAAESEIPRALAAAISDRLSFLSDETTETLRAAALLGPAFSVTDLGAIVGRSALDLTAALDEANAAGLLVESDVRLAFRHPLIRQTLHERTPAGLRLALHLQAARTLADAGRSAEQVAEQLRAALHEADDTPVMDGWIVTWLLGAGRILAYRMPEVAAELLRLAIDHLPAGDARHETLEAALAPALVLLGRPDEAVRHAEHVRAATTDPERAAEMGWTAGWAMMEAHRYVPARTLLGRTLRAPGTGDVWSARLHAMLAKVAAAEGDLRQAESEAEKALSGAEQTGDEPAAVAALNVQGDIRARRGDLDGAAGRFTAGLAAARLCDDPATRDLSLLVARNLTYVHLARGHQAEAERAVSDLLATAERSAAPTRLAAIRVLSAEVDYQAGRWDTALTSLAAAAESQAPMTTTDVRWAHGLTAMIALHRDDQPAAEKALAAIPDAAGGTGPSGTGRSGTGTSGTGRSGTGPTGIALSGAGHVSLARALLAERDGRPEEAVRLLLAEGGAPHHRNSWLPTLMRLALDTGDSAAAEAAAAACTDGARRPYAGFQVAVAQRCLGLLESEAPALASAVEGHRAANRPLQLAQTLEDSAVVLALGGDHRGARAAHAEASVLYTDLNATWELLRADTRLRRHGVHRRRGPRRRVATGWEALTPAELTVARLVADGRANPDIAANLFLSRRTVEVHVSHILTKLGLRSRVEIAREAARREPAPSSA